jgi:hypothetical protein
MKRHAGTILKVTPRVMKKNIASCAKGLWLTHFLAVRTAWSSRAAPAGT